MTVPANCWKVIVVLPNGVHTAQFEPREPDQELLDELGLRDKTVIGYAGGLVDYEGLDLLLLAAAELKKTRDDFAKFFRKTE